MSGTLKRGLVHGCHAGAVVLSWETIDVDFQRDGTNRRTEVKQAHLLDRQEGNREKRKEI